ncbi:MAG: phosphopyruvate hydratase [Aeropyrum sp.]|nr:phosphopyruvate hydratase [Aeropyrum sp.]
MTILEEFVVEGVRAVQVLDSRGRPTVKSYVRLKGGALGWGISPSGASRGEREAVEVRDGGKRWKGYGVGIAVHNVNKVIAPRIEGLDARRQELIDRLLIELDGTPNKSRLGGNATTSVSIAVARAAASQSGLELFKYLGGPDAVGLPIPIMNIINGGVHAGNELDFQEFIIVPHGFDSFVEALRAGVEIYHYLKEVLKREFGPNALNVGDEGGFAPPLKSAFQAFDLIERAVMESGYSIDSQVSFGLDAASSQFYRDGIYTVEGKSLEPQELMDFYEDLASRYPIVYLEDPFHEDDVEMFRVATSRLGSKMLIVGDDFFTTNPKTIVTRGSKGAGNAVLIKINQVGTLTETLNAISTARDLGMAYVVSHRSGDSEDPFIADLSVATNSVMIKAGAPARSERTSKYNRLLEIEEGLGINARYSGRRLKYLLKSL